MSTRTYYIYISYYIIMRHRVYSNKEQLVVGSTASRRIIRYYNTEFRDGNDRGNYVTEICGWIIFAQS